MLERPTIYIREQAEKIKLVMTENLEIRHKQVDNMQAKIKIQLKPRSGPSDKPKHRG